MRRKTLMRALPAAAGILLSGPLHALDFKDGRWLVTVTTEIRGMKVKPPPPYYYRRCFAQKDIQPHLAPSYAPCRAMDTEVKDDVMTWTLTCRDSGVAQMKGYGRMKFMGSRVEGMVTTISQYPEEMQVTQKISARRIGDCSKPVGTPLPNRAPRFELRDYDESESGGGDK